MPIYFFNAEFSCEMFRIFKTFFKYIKKYDILALFNYQLSNLSRNHRFSQMKLRNKTILQEDMLLLKLQKQ